MITVCCFLWRGWRPLYAAAQVNTLELMLRQYLTLQHRLICFTDMPASVRCETRPLPDRPVVQTQGRQPNCYRRLWLFSEAAKELGQRVLAMDLDAVILRSLDPLLTENDFRIVDGYTAPYNGSMWWLRTGSRTAAFDQFSEHGVRQAAAHVMPNGLPYQGSDQAWLGHILPGEATWKPIDGVTLYHDLRVRHQRLTGQERIVFFPGLTKPWHAEAARTVPKLHAHYKSFLDLADKR